MGRFFASFFRITARAGFLAMALLLGLALYYLPSLLHLDGLRPTVINLLENTFRCKAIVGNITGELIPYPGLVVGHVVLIEDSKRPRVLASVNAVHVWLSLRTLSGRLHVRTIRFISPRFILHREEDPAGEIHWSLLTLPGAQPFIGPRPAPGNELIEEWQIRNGSIEIWDHTTAVVTKWTADRFSGSFHVSQQAGVLTGKVPPFGRLAALNLRYDGNAAFPIEAHLNKVALQSIQSLAHAKMAVLDGITDLNLKARLQPDLSVQANIEPVSMVRLRGIHVYGRAALDQHHLKAHLQTDTIPPMILALEGDFRKTRWNFKAAIEGYDARLIRECYDQAWVNRLEGRGSITAFVQSGNAAETWSWTATGKDFGFAGTPLQIPEWSAQGDAQNVSVHVRANTPQGGATEVVWLQPAADADASLHVNVASMTIRQVLEVFNLQHQGRPSSESMNLYGYEPWVIRQGSMQSTVQAGKQLTVTQSVLDVEGMHLDLTGTFDLKESSPQAHIEGELGQIPAAQVIESFFKPPSPVTGIGQINFDLNFPLSAQWIRGLTGSLQLQIDNGVVKLLAAAYRIVSVLNLGNYLRLRFPQITAEGIEFHNVTGHLNFQNGVLSSDDLFLKSPNMNVGAKGSLDIPARRIDCKLRIEMFRFLEDILRDVPITHWIFRKPNKIFLPLLVSVEGPWDNAEVH